jgi:hypothetical protein
VSHRIFHREKRPQFNILFATNVRAYREALMGCAIARFQDRAINIRLPYINQGQNAFNGRTLDERAVNPFFQEHRVPSSRGPYLAAFRRSVRLRQRAAACATRPDTTPFWNWSPIWKRPLIKPISALSSPISCINSRS